MDKIAVALGAIIFFLAIYALCICAMGWIVWSAASLFFHLPAGSLGTYALVGAAISVIGGAFRATVHEAKK